MTEKIFSLPTMNDDDFAGMKHAVNNNQLIMAMYYATNLMNDMQQRIIELEAKSEAKPAVRTKKTESVADETS